MADDQIRVQIDRIMHDIFSFELLSTWCTLEQDNGRLSISSFLSQGIRMWTYIKMGQLSLHGAETALKSPSTLSCNVRWESSPEKSLHFLFFFLSHLGNFEVWVHLADTMSFPARKGRGFTVSQIMSKAQYLRLMFFVFLIWPIF